MLIYHLLLRPIIFIIHVLCLIIAPLLVYEIVSIASYILLILNVRIA